MEQFSSILLCTLWFNYVLADGQETSSTFNTTTIIFLCLFVVALIIIGVLIFVVFQQKHRTRDRRYHTTTIENPPLPSNFYENDRTWNYNEDMTPKVVPDRNPLATVGILRPIEQPAWDTQDVERVNAGLCARSMDLSQFCQDEVLTQYRVEYDELQFIKTLAKGANGEVWLAHMNKTQVAIKKLLKDNKQHIDAIEDFVLEIRVAVVVRHENIVEFLGIAWKTLHDLCLISEYMPYGDLAIGLRSKEARRWSWKREKQALAKDIASALEYLHTRKPQIVHRDLKSANILLTEELIAKLSDFGLSRERSVGDSMTSGIGTFFWTAPEVIRGKRYSEKADIYSYGIVLSELDTQLQPYKLNEGIPAKSNGLELLPRIARGEIIPQFRKDCPIEVLTLAHRCLDLEPQNRPSATEILNVLQTKVRPSL